MVTVASYMQIELPAPSWTIAPRSQDDAHTLTLPLQQALSLADRMPGALVVDADSAVRCAVPPSPGPTLTLTF